MRPLRITRPGPIIYSVALILATLLAILPAAVRASVPDEIVNETAARLFANEVYGNGNLSMVPNLVADDAPLHERYATRRGPNDVGRAVTKLRNAFPGARIDITEVAVEDDMALVRWTLEGTYRVGVIPGGAVAINGQWKLRLHEGMIVELWLAYDVADLARQITQAAYTEMENARGGMYLPSVAATHPQEWDSGVGPACGVTHTIGLDHLCPDIALA